MTLGNLIKDFRETNAITMDDFSKRSGLSKSYISILERGTDYRGNAISPSIETIDKVANAMNVDLDTVLSKIDQDVTINTAPTKQALTEFITEGEEAAAKWKFIKYCFEHASKEDRERALAILRVREKWSEFKEMENLFLS